MAFAALLIGLSLPMLVPSAASAARVGAVDNDPENKLWDCATRRVPFGDTKTDVLRCFTFRYAIPAGGITSAYLSLSVKANGDQSTDSLVLATAASFPECAWALGSMPGCTTLHGGLTNTQVSMTINLLDIACDSSIKPAAGQQPAVRAQLDTGLMHLMLQDDSAVLSAELVLNEGSPAECGASTKPPVTTPTTPPTTRGPDNGTTQIRAERPNYTTEETVTLLFSGLPGNAGANYDWISIAKAGAADTSYYDWRNVGGERDGRRDFGRLPAGSYEARAYFRWGAGTSDWTIQARSSFAVGTAPPTTAPPPCSQASGQSLPVPPLGSPEPTATACMTLQAGQRTVRAGQVVTIPVHMINGTNVANINYELTYDTSVAMAVRGVGRSSFLNSALQQANTEQAGRVLLGAAQTKGESGSGVLTYIRFTAVGKPGDRTPLRLNVTTLNDPAGTSLRIDRIDGMIQIVGDDGVVPGDCDGNNTLNEADALCALQMSVELLPPNTVLDVDRDGKVTSRDSAIILQRSVGRV